VSVCVITSFTTPALVRASPAIAASIDHHLPKSLQTFVSLYGSWLEQLRRSRRTSTSPHDIARLVRLLALDAGLFAAIIIGASVNLDMFAGFLRDRLGVALNVGRWIGIGSAALVCLPFALGLARLTRTLGMRLAARALPLSASARGDAARDALIVAFEIGALLLVGAPVVAITQPFLPKLYGVGVLLVVLGLLGFALFRRAADLQEHVQAGAQSVVDALARQSDGEPPAEHTPLLAGLGPVTPVALKPCTEAIGRTLAQLDLRARSGASVIAIRRGDAGLVQPTGREELQVGDVLALAGTHAAIHAASAILTAVAPQADPNAATEA
jgi:CPA2 family monovalent cation:H+ antiporter-2